MVIGEELFEFGWLIRLAQMKGWIRISLHFVDCRNGKKENGGVSVIDWVDLPDRDLLQIWVGMRCGWFVVLFGVAFEQYGWNDHLLLFPRFWLDFHHFRCGSSLFPCSHSDNALLNAPERTLRWTGSSCVWHKEESRASRWSVEVVLKSSDVYSWERNEVSTASDCDVILVLECLSAYQSDSGETGHV